MFAGCRRPVALGCALVAGAAAEAAPSAALRGSGAAEVSAASAAGAGCSANWKDCQSTRCCKTPGFGCYRKDQWYAQCLRSCSPDQGDEPWSCELVSGGGAAPPAPAPVPAPTPAPTLAPTPAPPGSAPAPAPAPVVTEPPTQAGYSLDWAAKGTDFFEGFDFLTSDGNHGASHYLPSLTHAKDSGVVETYASHAILRSGQRSEYAHKRQTAKIGTKKSWKHFLAVMKYSHVPYGCGVWPAFFTLGVGTRWPMGGEMDILEYVNDAGSMTSFHTGKQCKLDAAEVNRFRPMPDANTEANNGSAYDCHTAYCDTCTSLGCAPNVVPLLTGKQWASRPGVLAMERTAEFAKIFYIPEAEIPSSLETDTPNPDGTWDENWLIAYYPFAASPGCPDPDDIMAPQQFILSIAFCGDWASKVWGASPTCSRIGPSYNETATKDKLPISPESSQCRAVDPLAEYAPAEDCCTQYIADENDNFGTAADLRATAFFNISWFKVFT